MPPIDCFVRTMSGKDALRTAFLEATVARWKLDPECNLHILTDVGAREGRLLAEKMANSDPFVFSDDDVLPHGKKWLRHGTVAMLMNPEYGVCSTRSLIDGESPYKAEGEIFEVPVVGQPMWIRKNVLTDIGEYGFNEECIVLYHHVLKKGFKEGLINGIRHVHLGYGFSNNPSLCFGY